jgi:hypothetical protein
MGVCLLRARIGRSTMRRRCSMQVERLKVRLTLGLRPSTADYPAESEASKDFSLKLRRDFQNRNWQQGWVRWLHFGLQHRPWGALVHPCHDQCSVSRAEHPQRIISRSARELPSEPANPLLFLKRIFRVKLVERATQSGDQDRDVETKTNSHDLPRLCPSLFAIVFHIPSHPVILLRQESLL